MLARAALRAALPCSLSLLRFVPRSPLPSESLLAPLSVPFPSPSASSPPPFAPCELACRPRPCCALCTDSSCLDTAPCLPPTLPPRPALPTRRRSSTPSRRAEPSTHCPSRRPSRTTASSSSSTLPSSTARARSTRSRRGRSSSSGTTTTRCGRSPRTRSRPSSPLRTGLRRSSASTASRTPTGAWSATLRLVRARAGC